MSKFNNEFLTNGFVKFDVSEDFSFQYFLQSILGSISEHLQLNHQIDLDELHSYIKIDEVNQLRMAAYKSLNQDNTSIHHYHKIFKDVLIDLIGSELACQSKINLSIQMPQDPTSTLALHTDTISGQSKFEVVGWLPLTRAFQSNSMYIFSISDSIEMMNLLPEYQELGMTALFNDWKAKATFLELEPGEALLFSSNLMHGNILNETFKTRISLNSRYKGLFTPYSDLPYSEKTIGNFYKPLHLSPVTKLALDIEETYGEF